MLFIDQNLPDIKFALDEHVKYTHCLILKRIGSNRICSDPNCPVCKSKLEEIKDIPAKIIELLLEDDFIESIITGSPRDLEFNNELFFRALFTDYVYEIILDALTLPKNNVSQEQLFYLKFYHKQLIFLTKIFDYEGWFVANEPTSYYSAYHLSIYLNIRSCVYCNRSYTVSQFKPYRKEGGAKLIRPQFDHWFPKERYPLLALSFYNLIPSCSICNSSVKGRKQFSLQKYLHPYLDDLQGNILFTYSYQKTIDSVSVDVISIHDDADEEARIQNTLKDFYIKEVYNAHHTELKDLLRIKQAYSENYLKVLKDSFPGISLTDDEIYRLAFGVELNALDFHKRPFSKFKNDILKELEII